MNRVYVHSGRRLEQRRLARLRSRRAGASRPTARCSSSRSTGAGSARSCDWPAGGHRCGARVRLRSNVPVDHLEMVRNGEIVREIPLGGERTRRRTPRCAAGGAERLDPAPGPDRPGHRAGARPLPYATTSPIYLTRRRGAGALDGGRRLFPALDRPAGGVAKASQDWNTEAEREGVLAQIGRAREESRAKGRNAGLVWPTTAVQSPSQSPLPRRCTW